MTGAAVAFVGPAGCVVGPDYHTPAQKVPDQFHATTSAPAMTPLEAIDLAQWWKSLNDPILNALVEQAMASNLDLAIAATRVEQLRAERTVVSSGLWPTVDMNTRMPDYRRISAAVDRAHMESRPRGGVQLRQSVDKNGLTGPPSLYFTTPGNHPWNFLTTPSAPGEDPNLTTNVRAPLISPDPKQRLVGRDQFVFQAGLDATWELDVFGGVQRAIEAADADVEAQVEAKHDVTIILLADTARTYVELRGLQQRLDIALRNIEGQQTTVNLVKTRFSNGLTSDLDVALAERQLETTQSHVPRLRSDIDQARHRLSWLLDIPIDQLDARLEQRPAAPSAPPTVPAGLPSDLLRNRPDVRRAERDLAASTARIGVATADLFPRFSLTGSFGSQASDVTRMLDSDALVWSGGPGFRWPVFNAGRIVQTIHVQEYRAQEALLNYRRVLITAIREVQDALAAYAGDLDQCQKLREAVDSSNRAVRIARLRYEKGLTDFLNVLDAERALYELEDQAASSEYDARSQLILLYKALGHGWENADTPQKAGA